MTGTFPEWEDHPESQCLPVPSGSVSVLPESNCRLARLSRDLSGGRSFAAEPAPRGTWPVQKCSSPPKAPLGPQAAMPVAKKAQGGRVTVQHRPSLSPRQRCAANAPQGADPGPSPVTAHPSEPNGSSAAGQVQPLLPGCGAACSGTLQVVLCNHSLWLRLHRQQNEMTLSRPGRAMFPSLAYQIRGMEPRARYRVFVDMVRTDRHHWRYKKARWAPYRPEKSNVPGNQLYPHPDSPNTGAHWMQREVAFKTLRLTNAEPTAQSASRAIWLQSLHRYRPRLHIEELGCGDQEAPAAPSRSHIFSFPETEFIAVTAYRNAEIIRLKIDHNPYARAFRRDAASAGGLSAGQPPGPVAADPCAEAVLDPAGQRPWLPDGRDEDRGSATPGQGLQGPQPLWVQAAALPPSPLPPTSAAATPSQDRREATGSGTGEPVSLLPTSPGHRLDCLQSGLSKPQEPAPGAREQPRLHRETCTRGTQTDFPEAARGKKAPKKRRQCPGGSGSPAVSSAKAHGQAQAQRLPATEGSANASPVV
ncbi:T-box transcription factor TBX21-like [Antechinus flavipes]|uniref:T-box transcription factor TBX21-like n=1 Tax=Antechinus flavipes TaxID=38775 RepID=UPI0022366FF2|nr:T-box transcription factor TBX21-like [Antechinus flavipes]